MGMHGSLHRPRWGEISGLDFSPAGKSSQKYSRQRSLVLLSEDNFLTETKKTGKGLVLHGSHKRKSTLDNEDPFTAGLRKLLAGYFLRKALCGLAEGGI